MGFAASAAFDATAAVVVGSMLMLLYAIVCVFLYTLKERKFEKAPRIHCPYSTLRRLVKQHTFCLSNDIENACADVTNLLILLT